jgi:uncharacterized cupin superfamily protein
MNSSNSPSHYSIQAALAPARKTASNYPSPFAVRMTGRIKQPLGDLFGLKNFGVNLTTLLPGGVTALHHRHLKQDEFVYVLKGEPTLHTDDGSTVLSPGMCAGFPASGTAHHLENRTTETVILLEIGDRSPGDEVMYPRDDLMAEKGQNGKWQFFRKDKTPY